MNLIILSQEHFDKTKEFALRTGQEESFNNALARLERHCRDDRNVYLAQDFAPYSFEFAVRSKDNKQCFLNGGMIYHGSHDNGGDGGSPTFSVSINPTQDGVFTLNSLL